MNTELITGNDIREIAIRIGDEDETGIRGSVGDNRPVNSVYISSPDRAALKYEIMREVQRRLDEVLG